MFILFRCDGNASPRYYGSKHGNKVQKIQVASGMNMGPRPTINTRTTPHQKPTPNEKTHNDKTPHFKAKTILDMKTRLNEKTQSNEKSTPVQKTTHKGEHLQPAGGPKTFVVKTYLRYTLKSERMMEKNFPRFFKVYKLFKEGESQPRDCSVHIGINRSLECFYQS